MYDLSLNDTTIEKVKINVVDSLKEVMKLRSDIFLLDHIFNGGLNVRRIKTNER